jgi:hypothetical protein
VLTGTAWHRGSLGTDDGVATYDGKLKGRSAHLGYAPAAVGLAYLCLCRVAPHANAERSAWGVAVAQVLRHHMPAGMRLRRHLNSLLCESGCSCWSTIYTGVCSLAAEPRSRSTNAVSAAPLTVNCAAGRRHCPKLESLCAFYYRIWCSNKSQDDDSRCD